MKHLRVVFGLALIPLCTLLGSFIPVGTGSGIIIGCVLGVGFSYLFLTYGPGHRKSQLPTSYSLSHQDNGGVNQQVIEDTTLSARETAHYGWHWPLGKMRRHLRTNSFHFWISKDA